MAEGLQRKFSRLAVVELPAPRALEGRRREVRAAQRAILWVPSLRSTRTSEWTFWTLGSLFRCVALLESGPFRGPCWVVAPWACLVPSARRGGGLLPRGVCARAAGGAHFGYFCWCHFCRLACFLRTPRLVTHQCHTLKQKK